MEKRVLREGMKYDSDKLRYDLFPIEVIECIVDIFTYGAKKYAPNNWKKLEPFEDRYYAALMRHLAEWRKGNKIDKESGRLHIGHAAWNALALVWRDLQEHITTIEEIASEYNKGVK